MAGAGNTPSSKHMMVGAGGESGGKRGSLKRHHFCERKGVYCNHFCERNLSLDLSLVFRPFLVQQGSSSEANSREADSTAERGFASVGSGGGKLAQLWARRTGESGGGGGCGVGRGGGVGWGGGGGCGVGWGGVGALRGQVLLQIWANFSGKFEGFFLSCFFF